MIRVQDIHVRFGETEVLRGVDLEVEAGEVVALIGPSGSGKSTLIRCVNGLVTPCAGRVEVSEVVVEPATLLETRRRVGMVFQHFHLFPHMTALGNLVEAPVQVLGLEPEEAAERGRGLLAQVGLEGLEGRYPGELSGGQQQRVAIARALAMEPDALLFDEVTSALDPETVGDVLRVLRDLAEEGRTMVVVTHEMEFARQVADRVVFMEAGLLVAEGSPARMFDEPDNERVQAFLGALGARNEPCSKAG